MTGFDLVIDTLKFVIPSVFTILFRVYGLGYPNRRRLTVGLCVFAVYMAVVPPTLITVMGAITSYYVTLAEKREIVTCIEIDIPNEFTIDSLELAMALSNLFKNVIHGCEALPINAKKFILSAAMWGGC